MKLDGLGGVGHSAKHREAGWPNVPWQKAPFCQKEGRTSLLVSVKSLLLGVSVGLGELRTQSGLKQLQQVVGQAHDLPFRSNFFKPSEGEAS